MLCGLRGYRSGWGAGGAGRSVCVVQRTCLVVVDMETRSGLSALDRTLRRESLTFQSLLTLRSCVLLRVFSTVVVRSLDKHKQSTHHRKQTNKETSCCSIPWPRQGGGHGEIGYHLAMQLAKEGSRTALTIISTTFQTSQQTSYYAFATSS